MTKLRLTSPSIQRAWKSLEFLEVQARIFLTRISGKIPRTAMPITHTRRVVTRKGKSHVEHGTASTLQVHAAGVARSMEFWENSARQALVVKRNKVLSKVGNHRWISPHTPAEPSREH